MWHHPVWIEDAGFFNDEARLDAGCLFNEFNTGFFQGYFFTRSDRSGVIAVKFLYILIEADVRDLRLRRAAYINPYR